MREPVAVAVMGGGGQEQQVVAMLGEPLGGLVALRALDLVAAAGGALGGGTAFVGFVDEAGSAAEPEPVAKSQHGRRRRRGPVVSYPTRENSMKNRTGPSGSTRCRTSGTMTALDAGSTRNERSSGGPA